MTKKDLFILLIKIFGLYSLITTIFSVLPNNIAFVIQNIDSTGIIWLICTVFITVGLFYLLITKSEKISNTLKLEKGFDDDKIEFGNLKNIDIIKFVILIIGGFLFIENLPIFLSNTLFAFKSSIPKGFDDAYGNPGLLKYNQIEDYVYWITSGSNLLIGYLLISNYKNISDFLNKKLN
ncbi:hypothetical protein IU405_04890 [Polaribacter sp. BAL334]|uniref:hypothetical protein n=1 Tax=Polaribacter sp. BAL334 TaxID=1708178 RepID=UPI0018D2272D|nr:hypothetical protein [Polaribacter sp. BAL334]MBG7611582.1 hypothetical protein [Polaribacter sp. BAL334]